MLSKLLNFQTIFNVRLLATWLLIKKNVYIISIFLTFLEFSKTVLMNMVTILMMSSKIAILGLLKIKLFWKKGYDIILYVHNVTNKILSFDSNYIVDVAMWQKFGKLWSWFKSYNLAISSEKLKFRTNSYVCRSYMGKMIGEAFWWSHPEEG